MSDYELELAAEQTNDLKNLVVRYTAEGKKPTEIQRLTGLSFRDQREINDEFRALARSSEFVARRSKEIIAYSDVHFQAIIDRFNEVYAEAAINGDTKLQADILSKIVVAEAKRVEFLQKAGIINSNGIGEDMARMEARQNQIIAILKDAAKQFPTAATWIKQKLLELDGGIPSERVDLR